MEPYYEQDGIQIWHGDCREILPTLPPVDLVLTDPPYGIGYVGGGHKGPKNHSLAPRKRERIHGDNRPFDPGHLMGYRSVALFGAHHYCARLPDGGTFHVWDKRGDHQPIHTSDFDTIWINRHEAGRMLRCVWRGFFRDVERGQKILHPTQKPLRVTAWVLDMFPDTSSVLDPYMGSGTTLVVAKHAGIRAIGIEIEERYCEIAARRLQQSVLPLDMAS